MKKHQNFFSFWGRMFISVLFLYLAINKILNWSESEKELMLKLGNWQSYSMEFLFLQRFFTFLLQWVPATLLILVIFQILGGLLVFFKLKPKFGAFLLFFALIFVTLIYHPFWLAAGDNRADEIVLFFYNIAVLGGIFYIFGWDFKGKKELSLTVVKQAPLKGGEPSKKKDVK
jgi:uncharacterized membrane protein YphA (DoxX/SURF4 family)